MNYFPFMRDHVFSLTLMNSHLSLGLLAVSALAVVVTLYLGHGSSSRNLAPAALQSARSWHYAALSAVVLVALFIAASASGSAIWLSALTCAFAALIIFWLFLAPGRSTLSAARVIASGLVVWWGGLALTLSGGFSDNIRASLGAEAFVIPLMALGSLFPLGGWTTDIRKRVDGRAIAPWLLAVLPLLLISASTLKVSLPVELWKLVDRWLLPIGLVSSLIYALGWLKRDGDHYVRLAVADYALAFAVICTNSTFATLTALLLVTSHLLSGPVLLEAGSQRLSAGARAHWLMLSGIPPFPAFWGRLLALSSIAAYSQTAFVIAVVISGMHLLGCVAAVRNPVEPSPATSAQSVVPWVLGAAALLVGIFPGQYVFRVFGV